MNRQVWFALCFLFAFDIQGSVPLFTLLSVPLQHGQNCNRCLKTNKQRQTFQRIPPLFTMVGIGWSIGILQTMCTSGLVLAALCGVALTQTYVNLTSWTRACRSGAGQAILGLGIVFILAFQPRISMQWIVDGVVQLAA